MEKTWKKFQWRGSKSEQDEYKSKIWSWMDND